MLARLEVAQSFRRFGKGKREIAEVLRLLVQQGIAFDGIDTAESSLEDIFVDLVENRIQVTA